MAIAPTTHAPFKIMMFQKMSAIHDWCVGYLGQNEKGLYSLGFFATKSLIMHPKTDQSRFWIS